MVPYNVIPALLGILGLGSAWLVYLYVQNSPEGDGKVKEILIHKDEQVENGATLVVLD